MGTKFMRVMNQMAVSFRNIMPAPSVSPSLPYKYQAVSI